MVKTTCVTIEPDVNILALYRMLKKNGLWVIRVHNGRIVNATHFPKEQPIEQLVNKNCDNNAVCGA